MAIAVCSIPECYRPRNQRNGILHDFCSRSHAQEAVERGMIARLLPPHGTCHRCQLHGCDEEVFYDEDTGRVHDFCCLTHANIALSRGEWPPHGTQGSSGCQLPGCKRWVYRDPYTGEESAYCGRSHFDEASKAADQAMADATLCGFPGCGRLSWVDPESGDQLMFCGSRCAFKSGATHLIGHLRCSLPGCNEFTMRHDTTGVDMGYCGDIHRVKAEQRSLHANPEAHLDRTFRGGASNDFRLSVLTNQHHSYASVRTQFLSKFLQPIDGLTVERIFKIQVPGEVREKHRAYELTVGNTNRRFHGTSCSNACQFFVNLKGGPCCRPDCNICSICTHGFKLQDFVGITAQRTNKILRYGEGLYFSSVSGKANDYATGSEKLGARGKKWRCMFMCNVSVGKGYRTSEGFLPPNLCPPPGYDSVIGEEGQDLNFDEVVVYNENAALPTFLISYSFY